MSSPMPATAHATRGAVAALLITLLSACGGHHTSASGSGVQAPPPAQPVVKVIVTPSAFLVQPGGTAQLSAHAVDADGATVSGATITWSASSSVVSVDANGKVSAGNAVDSAVVVASVGAVKSAPVTALVASVTAGTQIIADDDVLSDPALIDTTQPPGVGSQLKTTLSGSAPTVGGIIVGAGDKPISGRVVSATPNGANTDVVYEVVPLDQVFTELKLNQTYSTAELTQQFDVQPASSTLNADGTTTYQFALQTPDPPAAHIHRPAHPHTQSSGHPADVIGSFKWKVGPFSCSAKADLSGQISLKNISPKVTPNFEPVAASISLSGGILNASLSTQGTVSLDLTGELHLIDKLTDSASCDAQLFKYIVPVPPVVAVVFVPVVPVVGVRASVSGTLSGDVVIDLKSTVVQPITIAMNLAGDGTFTNNSSIDPAATQTTFDWKLGTTNAADAIQFHGDAKAGLYAQVAFTNGFLAAYTLYDSSFNPIKTLIDGFVGLHATLGLATVNEQVQDPTVQTGYNLTALAEITAGSDVQDFVKFLSKLLVVKKIELPDFKYEPTLFSSPQGNARVSLRRFDAGSTLQFTVSLDPTTVDPALLGVPIIGYNVKQVEIWRKTAGGQSEMIGMDAGVAGVDGAPGKKDFHILWKADAAGVTSSSKSATSPANFYAVVVPNFGEDFEFRVGPALGWTGVIQLGGPNTQEGHRIAVDADGNVIVATISGDPLASENRPAVGGAFEVQLFKLTAAGELIWARNIDGAGDENVTGLSVDAQGNIFIAGRALDSSLDGSTAFSVGFSGWAASYSASGNQLWLKQWQDAFYSTAEYIALGPNRELYVLGRTSSAAGHVGGTVLSTQCTDIETARGQTDEDCADLTLKRLDPNSGALLWSQTDARAGEQIPRGLTVDAGGNIYTSALTGVDTTTQSTGVQGTDGADDFIHNWQETTANDEVVAHFGVALQMWNSDGSVGWRKDVKNPHQETAGGDVYSDEFSGGIVAANGGLWALISSTGPFPDSTHAGGEDSALFSVDPGSGEVSMVQFYGSAGDDVMYLYGPTPSGGLLLTGLTTGALFAPSAGNLDALVVSLGADGSPLWSKQFGGPGNDNGVGAAAAPDGSIYVTGFTDGLMPATLSGLPASPPINTQGGGEDLFIAKFSASLGTIQSLHPGVHGTR